METYPLVDEAQTALAARGPGIVELLLEAALGEVYDPDGPAQERAAETLDSMDPGEVSLGLAGVLCGRGDDQLKGAAVDALVALGGVAEPDLVVSLDDPVGGEWARAALGQLRYARDHPGAVDDEEPDGTAGEDVGEDGDVVTGAAATAESSVDDDTCAAAGDEADGTGPAAEGGPAGPDKDLVDDAYEVFLRRFEQESGGAHGDATGDSTAP